MIVIFDAKNIVYAEPEDINTICFSQNYDLFVGNGNVELSIWKNKERMQAGCVFLFKIAGKLNLSVIREAIL